MSVEVGDLKLRGPVLAASGTFGYGTEVPLLERRALGAIVSKGIFLRPRAGTPPPRIAETPSGMLNAIGLQGPGVEGLIRDYAPQWAQWDFPVFVNINGESAAEYGELAARLDGVPGVAGFEINISCPNVEQGGLYFGNDPRAAAAVTDAVRKRTDLPVWVKLTPMVTDDRPQRAAAAVELSDRRPVRPRHPPAGRASRAPGGASGEHPGDRDRRNHARRRRARVPGRGLRRGSSGDGDFRQPACNRRGP